MRIRAISPDWRIASILAPSAVPSAAFVFVNSSAVCPGSSDDCYGDCYGDSYHYYYGCEEPTCEATEESTEATDEAAANYSSGYDAAYDEAVYGPQECTPCDDAPPAYDEATKPAEAPYPAACVQMKGECRCYTQQATRLDVVASLCQQIVAGGFFVAWNRPVVQAVPISPAASASPTVLPQQQLYAQAAGIMSARPAPTVPAVIAPDEGAPPRVRNRSPG